MTGWTDHQGRAVALPLDNIDTDQLIPARFMSTPRSEGYGNYLLHDLRFNPDGSMIADMPLNKVSDASLLVARRNFGSGSSREAAVYALVDAGFRAVIAPSFGDIFANNAVNNGLLPATVSEADAETLIAAIRNSATDMTVSLETLQIIYGDLRIAFSLDPVCRTKLINGWDDIDLTRAETGRIKAYRENRRTEKPWIWPS